MSSIRYHMYSIAKAPRGTLRTKRTADLWMAPLWGCLKWLVCELWKESSAPALSPSVRRWPLSEVEPDDFQSLETLKALRLPVSCRSQQFPSGSCRCLECQRSLWSGYLNYPESHTLFKVDLRVRIVPHVQHRPMLLTRYISSHWFCIRVFG